MKIKAVVASTFKDYENGWSYSESALISLAKSSPNIPIIFRKNKIGIVESGKYEDGRVVITAKIEKNEEILGRKLYLVPGGLTDFVTEGNIISKCAAHQYFLTETTSNKELPIIEEIGS